MRYNYQSQGFKNDFYGFKNKFQWTPVTILITLNTLLFLLTQGNNWSIHQLFGISNYNFYIWQIFTYMFLHGGITHLFFNMFLLWMFGKKLEILWGPIRFIQYYVITGIGAGLCIYFFSEGVTIGASGAIMAILFAYGYIYPNQRLFFWFIPMRAKYAIIVLIIMELSQELARNPSDNISHVGHLGGMLVGFLYLKFGHNIFQSLSFIKIRKVSKTNKEDIALKKVDDILDKLKVEGWDGLSDKEKSILFQASKQRRDDKHLN